MQLKPLGTSTKFGARRPISVLFYSGLMNWLLLVSFCVYTCATPQLVHVQAVWRHGDRTPLGTYQKDPYQESFWQLPWGTLTKLGMQQQYETGSKLKALYIDQHKFINSTFKIQEVKIISADTPRCTVSAGSNFAAFYADSTFHPKMAAWPKNWTPMPIHSLPKEMDNLLEPGVGCDRADILIERRVTHENFMKYTASVAPLILEIMEKSGETLTDLVGLIRFSDSIFCERAHNLTFPVWLTDDIYNQVMAVKQHANDFVFGMPGFGLEEDVELISLRGGPLLEKFINNMQGANTEKVKYHAYSAHDTSVLALLYTLGNAKNEALGKNTPDYAATVVFELWKMDDGTMSVKILFTPNSTAGWNVITSAVTGCPNSDFCPLSTFIARSQKYISKDWTKECLKL